MFLKSYKVKSNVLLKGSEARRFRQRLETVFPELSVDQVQTLLPAKANVTQIKVVTHKEFQTNVYCVDKLPMFFEMEGGVLVPTLYALWLVPVILPYFTTFPNVLPKLSNGADLLLPGVVTQGTGYNMYGRYKKNQLMAVNLTSNKAAVGVGYLPHSSDDLYMCGGRGIAVKMLHLFGDKLWAHEPLLVQQVPNQKSTNLLNEDFPELGTSNAKKISQTSNSNPNSFTNNASQTAAVEVCADVDDTSQTLEVLNIQSGGSDIVKPPEEQSPTEQALTHEQSLKKAFLAALKNHGNSLQLPLLTSNFYRLYVLPEAEEDIDLKKTKYKKVSAFLRDMVDQGFIELREEVKGVDKITRVDLQHPELVNFITDIKTPSQSAASDNTPQPLFHSQLTEMYIVTDATASFFTKLNFKRGEGIPAAQIKKIVYEYISKQNLPQNDPVAKSTQLDETLKQICNCEAASVGKICSSLISHMKHTYQMCAVNAVSHSKPLITMSLATRSGSKKVTLVSNVECYGIILSEFIKLCKQGAAASTTIVKNPHQNREQLQIQGNQVRFIYNLLTETYKVPPKCILGLELARDAKKHKKK